jgi:hypothetical protein
MFVKELYRRKSKYILKYIKFKSPYISYVVQYISLLEWGLQRINKRLKINNDITS